MKRLLTGLAALGLIVAAAAVSGNSKLSFFELQVQQEDRNPWTHLRVNSDPNDFQFVVVSDRTGGHRAAVFSRAVEQINLLQPEFVISVGDLIEGYTKDPARLANEWKEFQGYVCKLQMPFFYVPGNHDISNDFQDQQWKERFGRRWYHFVYRDVLFLMLHSDDPPGKEGAVGEQQLAWVRKTLDENRSVRWTIVALHRPLWASTAVDKNGWLEVEKALAGRKATVFAGHVHGYQKFNRNGLICYQLATTGGVSKLRGVRYGEFDHIVWVTMKKDGPVLANIMLDGIWPEDMKPTITDEPAHPVTRRPPHPVKGKVFFDGTPTPHAQIAFHLLDASGKKATRTGDAFVDPDGSFVLSSYTPNDGAPTGEYGVTVVWRQPWVDAQGKAGPNLLPDKYARPDSSDLRVRVKEGINEFTFELKR
jgi:predicted phosphodiesterase